MVEIQCDYPVSADLTQCQVGKPRVLPIRRTREIRDSRIGVGMECLDRMMFTPERTYSALAELGAKWARLQTGWSRCETARGVYDTAWLHTVVDAVVECGVSPWFNLGYGNKLYATDTPHASAVGAVPVYYDKAGHDAWIRFVTLLALQFGEKVTHWEIWNEPNTDNFWLPKPNPEDYAKLVHMSANAIHSVAPEARIIAGAVSNPYAIEYMERALQAGMGSDIQYLSYHVYSKDMSPEPGYVEQIDKLRELLGKYAPHVRLWQGEAGCPSITSGHNDDWMELTNMNEANQAKWVIRRALLDIWADVARSQYFHLCDLTETPYVQANGQVRKPVMMGLLRSKTYEKKKAFFALQSVSSIFDARALPDRNAICRMTAGGNDLRPYFMQFRRGQWPLLAYSDTRDPQIDTGIQSVDLEWRFGSDARSLTRPVVVDPIAQKYYPLTSVTARTEPGVTVVELRGVPLTNSPFIIADADMLLNAAT